MKESLPDLSLTRAAFVGASSLHAGPRWPNGAGQVATPTVRTVNDIHSRLNATRVAAVERPTSRTQLQALVRGAASRGMEISVAGGRHAMGGQQFGKGSLLIDMGGLDRALSLDRETGIVEVEGGIQWPGLVAWLEREQRGEAHPWSIVQKQTGADRLSLGGALSANVHGRGLQHRPIVQDVESLVLIDAAGRERPCSREHNAELFALAIGGYGLFGPIVSVRLRLGRRYKVERVVEVMDVEDVAAAFEQRIADGFEYGDFQFATDESDEAFVRRGVFSCYRPVSDDLPIPATRVELSEADAPCGR